MRIQFTGSVSVPGGPRYHAGEIIETDPYLLTEARAAQYLRHGWAVAVPEPAPTPVLPPPMKAPDRPSADKMVRQPGVKK